MSCRITPHKVTSCHVSNCNILCGAICLIYFISSTLLSSTVALIPPYPQPPTPFLLSVPLFLLLSLSSSTPILLIPLLLFFYPLILLVILPSTSSSLCPQCHEASPKQPTWGLHAGRSETKSTHAGRPSSLKSKQVRISHLLSSFSPTPLFFFSLQILFSVP
jgi:hypothetical protein